MKFYEHTINKLVVKGSIYETHFKSYRLSTFTLAYGNQISQIYAAYNKI